MHYFFNNFFLLYRCSMLVVIVWFSLLKLQLSIIVSKNSRLLYVLYKRQTNSCRVDWWKSKSLLFICVIAIALSIQRMQLNHVNFYSMGFNRVLFVYVQIVFCFFNFKSHIVFSTIFNENFGIMDTVSQIHYFKSLFFFIYANFCLFFSFSLHTENDSSKKGLFACLIVFCFVFI